MKANSLIAKEVLTNVCIILCTFLNWSGNEALVEVFPSEDVQYICHGGQLNLTCATNETFLEWIVTVPLQIPSNRRITLFESLGKVQTLNTSGRIIFYVWRSPPTDLHNDSLPLVSMLVSDNVSSGLNGTTVTCSGIETRIHIIGNSSAVQNPPNMTISKHFLAEHVSVTLEWTNNKWPVQYEVNVNPPVNITVIESTTVQLVVPYNTVHNVSVTSSNCGYGQRNTSTTYKLSYGRCNHPLHQLSSTCIQAIDYMNPATVGTNVTLRCSSKEGDLEQAVTITTCMDNGKWSQDPLESCLVNCSIPNTTDRNVSFIYNSTLEGSSLMVLCQKGLISDEVLKATCHCDGNWTPDPLDYDCSTSVSDPGPGTRCVTGLLFGLLGMLCVLTILSSVVAIALLVAWRKEKVKSIHLKESIVSPVYECPTSSQYGRKEEEMDLEMTKNASYGQLTAIQSV